MNDSALQHVDIAVLGGGLAGLIAALAAHRHSPPGTTITLVTGSEPGGRARCDERDGYVFNRGPRALYAGGALERVLTEFGVGADGHKPPTDGALAWSGGRLVPLPQGLIGLLRTPLFHGGDRARMARLLARIGHLDSEEATGLTVGEWVDSLRLDDDAAALVHALVRVATYTNAPHVVEASAAVANLRAAFSAGVHYLDGGWQVLVDQLLAKVRDAGITVRQEVAVSMRPVAGAHVVTTPSGQLHADTSVLAIGSASSCAAVLGYMPAAWASLGPAAEVACLELGLRRPPTRRFALGIDEPLYFSTHCPPARLAPDGAAVVHLMAYLPVDDDTDSLDRKAQLRSLAWHMGVTADDIVTERFLARMVAQTAVPTAHPTGLAGRPGIAVPERHGVYVAGDWVGAEGMLSDAVAASAAAAGRAAAAHVSAMLAVS
jgi:protoporphyrinogen oxidase